MPRSDRDGPVTRTSATPGGLEVAVKGGVVTDEDALPSFFDPVVQAVLASQGVTDAEISLTLLDDAEIGDLNLRYLGKDRPTDVIAFPLEGPGRGVVGDVYVGVEQALRQARELGVDPREELVRLTVHGVLHVLGHDHPEGPEREDSDMFQLQERLVAQLLTG